MESRPDSFNLEKKQVRSPVWQVGPVGCAFTRIVSQSQSMKRSFTRSLWPDVSPFSQSFCLDRLQKCTDLVARVRANASWFIYPSMRTVPSSQSWMTAGSSPCSLNFSSRLPITLLVQSAHAVSALLDPEDRPSPEESYSVENEK